MTFEPKVPLLARIQINKNWPFGVRPPGSPLLFRECREQAPPEGHQGVYLAQSGVRDERLCPNVAMAASRVAIAVRRRAVLVSCDGRYRASGMLRRRQERLL
jgi:hypothetical protein